MKIDNFFQKNKTINEDMEDYFYEEEAFENKNVEPLESLRENVEEQNIDSSTEDIDMPNLIKKLNYLDKKYDTDLDVICLKALCSSPDSEGKIQAVEEILKNLISKYPKDIKIRELIYNDIEEEIPLKKMINSLSKKYEGPEIVIIKALANTPDSLDKENALRKYLIKLLQTNPNDSEIRNYLGIKKERKENMVFIESTNLLEVLAEKRNMLVEIFKEELLNEETPEEIFSWYNRKICNLYASKYLVTQEEWKKFMGTTPSAFTGDKKPVEHIKWIEALEFCNKVSQYYNLQPVYKIEKNLLDKIIYKNGEEVEPDLADFSKTEGYRLPTYLETQVFGLKVDINQKRNDIAWFYENSREQTWEVGLKEPNKYGMYDVFGNVIELCYDTETIYEESGLKKRWYFETQELGYENKNQLKEMGYIYNKNSKERIGIGGGYSSYLYTFELEVMQVDPDFLEKIMVPIECDIFKKYSDTGFRIVRTAERL